MAVMTGSIVPYRPYHQEAFERLNRRWLETYFKMEPIDAQVLGNPQTHIIDPGGWILMAELEGHAVGTCALKTHGHNELELTKMAVDPAAQGQGLGKLLIGAAITSFLDSGRELLWLETNHVLTTAIRLYKQHGFVRIGSGPRPGSGYQRSDYYMQWRHPQPGNPV